MKGKYKYVPSVALECLGHIERTTGKKGSEAFEFMARKAAVGLELDMIESRFFGIKKHKK